jgi:hypothetical protein
MAAVLGPVLAGAGAVLGGAASFGSGRRAARAARFATESNNYWNQQNFWEARRQFDENFALQEDLARNGLAIRVRDAVAAGIHPLAAIGGSPAQAGTPITVSGQTAPSLGGAEGNALAGESIARVFEGVAQMLEAFNNNRTPDVVTEPQRVTVTHPDNPRQEPVPLASTGFMRTKTGLMPVMSADVKQRLEEDETGTTIWNWKQRFFPRDLPPKSMVQKEFPGAAGVKWSQTSFEFQPIYQKEADRLRRGYHNSGKQRGRRGTGGYQPSTISGRNRRR